MTGPLSVYIARCDTGTRCCKCGGAIREGQEYATDRWTNGGGFDHLHVECPTLADNSGQATTTQGAR